MIANPHIRRSALKKDHFVRANQGDCDKDRILSIDDVSKLFQVSKKTIRRWRDDGLVASHFVSDGRNRVGFLQSAVEQFASVNPDRVRRGSSFCRMTEQEREQVIALGKSLARQGMMTAELLKELAEKSNRSIETIRYTLKAHDQANPDQAIIAGSESKLSQEQKNAIYLLHRQGLTAKTIAQRKGKSRTKILRCISEMRAKRIRELPLDYVASSDFSRPELRKQILAECPPSRRKRRTLSVPPDLPAYLAELYQTPLLTAEQEHHLFRKYNFLKYEIARLRGKLDAECPKAKMLGDIERLYQQAVEIKNSIIKANLRLVVSVVKFRATDNNDLFDRISSGNVSLMKAIEKFDYTRGFKFSTYATWAIKRNATRDFVDQMRRFDRFKTGKDAVLLDAVELRSNPRDDETAHTSHESQVSKLMAVLNDRERQVIRSRFGLGQNEENKTLREIGLDLGVSKERVRQIQLRAMQKLRDAAGYASIDDFEV